MEKFCASHTDYLNLRFKNISTPYLQCVWEESFLPIFALKTAKIFWSCFVYFDEPVFYASFIERMLTLPHNNFFKKDS